MQAAHKGLDTIRETAVRNPIETLAVVAGIGLVFRALRARPQLSQPDLRRYAATAVACEAESVSNSIPVLAQPIASTEGVSRRVCFPRTFSCSAKKNRRVSAG